MGFSTQEHNLVEALEDGRIVRVSESYAKREGLTILRNFTQSQNIQQKLQDETKYKIQKEFRDERSKKLLDYLRKPAGWKDKQVISELIPNFNWDISKKRRYMGMTRKQLAKLVGTDEDSIKLIENGLLPTPDFVLINKIQTALKLNLRKDKKDFTKEVTLENIKKEAKNNNPNKKEESKNEEEFLGDDIEIIE